MDSPALSGYRPMPDQFLGEWKSLATRSGVEHYTITPTPKGAVMVEHGLSFDSFDKPLFRIHPSTTTITLHVFSVQENTVYAIAKTEIIFDKTKKLARPVDYNYYRFVYEKADAISKYDSIAIKQTYHLHPTEEDMNASPAAHFRRLNGWPCYPEKMKKCLDLSSYYVHSK
jgi:hypothetical protein